MKFIYLHKFVLVGEVRLYRIHVRCLYVLMNECPFCMYAARLSSQLPLLFYTMLITYMRLLQRREVSNGLID